MAGVFASWQPKYAAAGIATFPVNGKKPAVKHYLRAGHSASRQFADRFPNADAFGFACESAGIAVLDIDSPSDNLLADAIYEFGSSPIIIRSGSGNHQVWYRRTGQRRRIRPQSDRPIDILGRGYVVAPPSVGARGSYQFLSGSLQDIASLPAMRDLTLSNPSSAQRLDVEVINCEVNEGSRNNTVWRHCMGLAKQCASFELLVLQAQQFNTASCSPPLTESEVVGCAASAWRKTNKGENWFGIGGIVALGNAEVQTLVETDQDALLLLAYLKSFHWGRDFVIANAMHKKLNWTRVRLAAARKSLEIRQYVTCIRPAARGRGPSLYRWKDARVSGNLHQ